MTMIHHARSLGAANVFDRTLPNVPAKGFFFAAQVARQVVHYVRGRLLFRLFADCFAS